MFLKLVQMKFKPIKRKLVLNVKFKIYFVSAVWSWRVAKTYVLGQILWYGLQCSAVEQLTSSITVATMEQCETTYVIHNHNNNHSRYVELINYGNKDPPPFTLVHTKLFIFIDYIPALFSNKMRPPHLKFPRRFSISFFPCYYGNGTT